MTRYSTNWMGVINLQWYIDRGLTKKVTRTLTEDSKLTGRKAGESFDYDDISSDKQSERLCRRKYKGSCVKLIFAGLVGP